MRTMCSIHFFAQPLVTFLVFFVIVAVYFLFMCPVQAATLSRVEIERRVEKRINAHRVSLGLEPLTRKKKIVQVARTHSMHMATGAVDFGHDGFSERFDALQGLFEHLSGAGENVAYTTADKGIAKQFVEMWLDSEGHRTNIENPNFNLSGVGIKKENDRYYITHIFLTQQE